MTHAQCNPVSNLVQFKCLQLLKPNLYSPVSLDVFENVWAKPTSSHVPCSWPTTLAAIAGPSGRHQLQLGHRRVPGMRRSGHCFAAVGADAISEAILVICSFCMSTCATVKTIIFAYFGTVIPPWIGNWKNQDKDFQQWPYDERARAMFWQWHTCRHGQE